MKGVRAIQFIYKVLGEWSLELVREDKMMSDKPLESWLKEFREFLSSRRLPSDKEDK